MFSAVSVQSVTSLDAGIILSITPKFFSSLAVGFRMVRASLIRVGSRKTMEAMLSGGAANSHVWCQIFSDILNMEIITTTSTEVGILGLAIYQALGLGLYRDLKEAIDNMVTIKSVFKPDKNKNRIYMRRFEKFQEIIKLLDS